MQNRLHVKKGDHVVITAGRDSGKQGKIIQVLPKRWRVVVEGLNEVKRHTKPNAQNRQGGIVTKSLPIHVSNVMRIDLKTEKPAEDRKEQDAADAGTKTGKAPRKTPKKRPAKKE